ncbi:MAG: hypothetical protein ACREPE_11815 [Lysobacter sp.]
MNELAHKVLASIELNDAEKLAIAIALCPTDDLPSLIARIPTVPFWYGAPERTS